MSGWRSYSFPVSMFLILLFIASGCGDAPDSQVEDGDSNADATWDCADDEYPHPVTEECIVEPDESGGDTGNDQANNANDDDQPPSQCDATEVFDEDSQECIADEPECGPGTIVGRVCLPVGQGIPNAELSLTGDDCDGAPFIAETRADNLANFEFTEIPAGEHQLTVADGLYEVSVTVRPGKVADLSGGIYTGKTFCKIEPHRAVLDGAGDDVGDTVQPFFGEMSTIGPDSSDIGVFLADFDAMAQYHDIIIESGVSYTDITDPLDASTITNINFHLYHYLTSDNTIFVTGEAHQFVEKLSPALIEFDDQTADYSPGRLGAAQTVTVEATSTVMDQILDGVSEDFQFPVAGWRVPTEVSADATVHLRADIVLTDNTIIEDAPLLIEDANQDRGGRLIYSAFAVDDQNSFEVRQALTDLLYPYYF